MLRSYPTLMARRGAIVERLGHVADGRALIEIARERSAEFGSWNLYWGQQTWDMEKYGGDLKAAEHALRGEIECGERAGMTSTNSSTMGYLAECLCELATFDEVEQWIERSRATTDEYDLESQISWRKPAALLHAHRGDHAEAETLARETVADRGRHRRPDSQADTRLVLADTLRLAGRTEDATTALRSAIELYEAEGQRPRRWPHRKAARCASGGSARMSEHDLPAWSLPSEATAQIAIQSSWPKEITRDWAYGGSTGAGARVCILDSGVDAGHPAVGEVQSAVVFTKGEDGEPRVDPDTEGDVCGHGTACAGIVRALAPEAEIHSVRVLGPGYTGSGKILLAGLPVRDRAGLRHRQHEPLDDEEGPRRRPARARGRRLLQAHGSCCLRAQHAGRELPWRFSSVISVGSHMEEDPMALYYNPNPPVEFFARGVEVDVAWLGGETIRCTGNSFATPHVAGICALIRSKHPELTPFELKSLLHLTSRNVADRR